MKKLLSILLALTLMLSLGVTALATNDSLRPDGPYTLTIHKYKMDDPSGAYQNVTGTTADADHLPGGAQPLNGATFSITQVEEVASGGTYTVNGKQYNAVASGHTDSQTTATVGGVNGVAVFTIPDGKAGIYLVQETATPTGVTGATADFVIDIPMTKVDGSGWLTAIDVYPKNELVQGAAILTKTDENDAGLNGVTFKLLRATTDPADFTDPAKYVEVSSGLTTGSDGTNDGKLAVNGLQKGTYAFVETAVAAGSGTIDYGLNTTPQIFEISATGSVNTSASPWTTTGTVVETKSGGGALTLKNYDLPDIDKSVDLDASGAAIDVGDEIEFTVTSTLPTDLANYTEYYIYDDLITTQLNYVTNSAKVYGVSSGTDTLLTENTHYKFSSSNSSGRTTLTLTFKDSTDSFLSEISSYDSIKLVFKAEVVSLDTTVTNTATLDYNNGVGDDGDKTTTPDPTDPDDPVLNSGSVTITKIKAGDGTTKLAGAKFNVYVNQADALAGQNALVVDTPTDSNGELVISDLIISGPSRTFWLVETKAPTGYKLMTTPVSVTVSETSAGVYTGSITVEDEPSSVIDPDGTIHLPATGGIGTLLFTAVGMALIAGGSYAISRKRREDRG